MSIGFVRTAMDMPLRTINFVRNYRGNCRYVQKMACISSNTMLPRVVFWIQPPSSIRLAGDKCPGLPECLSSFYAWGVACGSPFLDKLEQRPKFYTWLLPMFKDAFWHVSKGNVGCAWDVVRPLIWAPCMNCMQSCANMWSVRVAPNLSNLLILLLTFLIY